MGNSVKRRERIRAGLRRIAGQQALAIREYFQPAGVHDADQEHIHRVRTAIKKLRALLRLVRPGLPGNRYRRERDTLRILAQMLAPLRDAEVMTRQLRKLRRQLSPRDFSALQRIFVKEQHHRTALLKPAKMTASIKCRPILDEIGNWPLKEFKSRNLYRGLQRAAKKLTAASRQARQSATGENLHEWRKRAKDLAFQLKLIRKRSPKSVARRAARLAELARLLGNDHDLAVFREKISGAPLLAKRIGSLLERRRAKLQRAAFKLDRSLRRHPLSF